MSLLKIFHWGPLVALGIIKVVTIMTVINNNMWWPPWTSPGAALNAIVFLGFAYSTLYYFLCALTIGPGYVPLKWEPKDKEDCQYLQYCGVCEGYKAPRAHHCRKCGRCVKKMDHHCPWINGCVGWSNHLNFTLFLLSAVLGCAHGTVVMCCALYTAINRSWYIRNGIYYPVVQYSLTSLVFTVFAVGLAIGVVIAVGMLFYFQLKSIIINRTGIELWIEEKANHRLKELGIEEKFIFPYDLGWKKNIKELYKDTTVDGIIWPVREDCNQYSLTIEQLHQKVRKRECTLIFSVERRVRGGWCPITAGCCTIFHPPCSDESRIALEKGDIVLVSRSQKYWLFGEKLENNKRMSAKTRIRGWFPRNAAVKVVGEVDQFLEEDNDAVEESKKDA